MLGQDWETVAERLWRSFVELRQVVEDTNVDDRICSSEALRQFCRHAFELRDWLVTADIDAAAKEAVRQLFGTPSKNPAKRRPPGSIALAACADIANRSKHAVLNGPSFSEGGHANVTSEGVSSTSDLPEFAHPLIDDVPRFGDHQSTWIISVAGTDYDALLLAEDAMADWTMADWTMADWTNCLVHAGLVAAHPNGWSFARSAD